MEAPPISKAMLGFFRRIVRGYFRRHFHGVRISSAARFSSDGGPLIVYANHSSWWDPMVCILLAGELMPSRSHYAPMDAEALQRYSILKHVGIFPVEMKTVRGAVQFLRTGEAILKSDGILWVTPQGRFADVRERPLVFKTGLSALASRVGACTLLPLAIEYPFWDERLPEVLLHFGQPVRVESGQSQDNLQALLAEALEGAMKELEELALARDASAFATLSHGGAGVGGLYAMGKRVKSFLLREPYQAEHTKVREVAASRKGANDL